MSTKPYIGITGPSTVQETKDICTEFANAGYTTHTPYSPMLGFLVSQKTLHKHPIENRRYPQFDLLPELLRATNGNVLTMIHYNSTVQDTLADQVTHLFEKIYDNRLCRALQLNVVWPSIKQVEKIKERHPGMQIVFQASHKATKEKTPQQVAAGIKQYDDTIDYVLIDPSGGRGLEFDINSSIALFSEIRMQCPRLRIGFAGGYTAENVIPRTKELQLRIGTVPFCNDIEGGLRDKITDAYGDDTLNIQKVRQYLQNTSTVMR